MDRDQSCFDRYFRNVSTQRLLLYGVVLIAIIVVIVLLIVLLPGGESKPSTAEKSGRAALEIVPLIDGHNNLPAELAQKLQGVVSTFPWDKASSDPKYDWCQTDLQSLKDGMVGAQVWTIKVPCVSQYKDAVAKGLHQTDAISRLIDKYNKDLNIIKSANDINKTFADKKIGCLLAMEGGHTFDNRLSVLRAYYRLGIRIMSLTSECSTPWAASYTDRSGSKLTLTDFGQAVIKEMNRLGMIIDLANLKADVQLKVLEISKAPCIISTAAVYGINANDRNVKDEVLDQIKKYNGLVMISFDANLIDDQKKKKAITIDDVITHINYIRERIGVNHIGLGAGFDTDGRSTVQGLENPSKYPGFFDKMEKPPNNEQKWTVDELTKLAGLNFQRVFQNAESARDSLTEGPSETLLPVNDIAEVNRGCYSK